MDSVNISRQYPNLNRARTRYPNPFDDLEFEPDDDVESDEFRMYSFKVKMCVLNRAHDWTICPYAHQGERARRRDPLKVPYVAVSCADFQATTGYCPRGELCRFTHGVFEYWLHPTRYRTRMCNAGEHCTREVCFFAHSAEELRVGSVAHLPKWFRLALHKNNLQVRAQAQSQTRESLSTTSVAGHDSNTSDGPGLGVIGRPQMSSNTPTPDLSENSSDNKNNCVTTDDGPHELKLEFLESLKMLANNRDYYNNKMMQSNNAVVDCTNGKNSDMPNFDWVSELLTG